MIKIKDYHKYVIKCPCCGTIINVRKEDVYKCEDEYWVYHEYIDCPECYEAIMLNDANYFEH